MLVFSLSFLSIVMWLDKGDKMPRQAGSSFKLQASTEGLRINQFRLSGTWILLTPRPSFLLSIRDHSPCNTACKAYNSLSISISRFLSDTDCYVKPNVV